MTRRWSIARQLFVLQVLVVLSLVAIGTAGAVRLARADAEQAAIEEVSGIAEAFARSPMVVTAIGTPNPPATLQPYAESTRLATGTDFIVVMAPDRTRYSHPTPSLIGQPFVGSIAGALAGGTVVETTTGSLGESVRTVVPVRDPNGRIIGLVSVGITTEAINRRLLSRAPAVLVPTALALLAAAGGSWLLSRRLRRQTHGLGPAEMTRMYEYHDAVLHSVREGLVVVDRDGRVTLVNDEGRRLLGLPEDAPVDRQVADLELPPGIGELLASREPVADEPVLAGDRILVANQRVIRADGHTVGTVLTLRDHTELRSLTGELDSVRGLTEALRAQAHEAANRLHTVLTMVELGRTDEAVRLATEELAVAQQLTDQVVGAVSEPALAALLLGKSAQAGERGVQLDVDEASRLDGTPLPGRDLLTVVGNLVDNALEAVVATEPPRKVTVLIVQSSVRSGAVAGRSDGQSSVRSGAVAGRSDGQSSVRPGAVAGRSDGESGGEVLVRVSDTGPGLADAEAAFRRGWTTKQQGRGLGLALVRQVVERYGGSYDVTAAPGGGAVVSVRLPVPS